LLDDGQVANFVQAVASRYTLATLHRILEVGGRMSRRGAAMAVTLLGREESVPHIGRALHDSDRAVRVIAEDGLQAIWLRSGTLRQSQRLRSAMRLNAAGQHAPALCLADSVVNEARDLAEAWFQRAEAWLGQGEFDAAIADCRQALASEPYHFPALLAMAQGYLELGDLLAAIDSLQQALRIHPHLEFARAQLARLEREVREQSDR
jgi:tetratricopeptide (TPR) repeat protein